MGEKCAGTPMYYTTGYNVIFQERVRLKITQSKTALLRVKLYFPRKRKNKIYPVKTSVNSTQGTRQFSQEIVRLKINQSKLVLVVQGYNAIFQRKSKTKNHPVKIIVDGTQGTMIFSHGRGRLFKNYPVINSVNGTKVQCYYL